MSDVKLPPLFGAINTATREIAAPPERVWCVLFDRAKWVPKFVSKTPLDGPGNAVGERAYFASLDEEGQNQTRIEEILLSVPHRRLVTRLALADDDATFGFAEWRIVPLDSGCHLEMNLYWLDFPEADSDWVATRRLRDSYLAHTQAIIEGLVENIRRRTEQ